MENRCEEQGFVTLETGVFEILGELAIVINGAQRKVNVWLELHIHLWW